MVKNNTPVFRKTGFHSSRHVPLSRDERSTNNRAEYRALIRGLEVASKQGCTGVKTKSDSQLVVRQVTGEWQTNEQHLRELRDRVQELADEFETFEIEWVDRNENLRADELVDREFDD